MGFATIAHLSKGLSGSRTSLTSSPDPTRPTGTIKFMRSYEARCELTVVVLYTNDRGGQGAIQFIYRLFILRLLVLQIIIILFEGRTGWCLNLGGARISGSFDYCLSLLLTWAWCVRLTRPGNFCGHRYIRLVHLTRRNSFPNSFLVFQSFVKYLGT
jgi:hypothetical protein